jgi:hypothetical protein
VHGLARVQVGDDGEEEVVREGVDPARGAWNARSAGRLCHGSGSDWHFVEQVVLGHSAAWRNGEFGAQESVDLNSG